MQGDPRYYGGKAPMGEEYETGFSYGYEPRAAPRYGYGAPAAAPAAFPEHHEYPAPLGNVEFQPSATCPRNYVIFDQTYTKSRVMFHPSLAHRFSSPGFNSFHGARAEGSGVSACRDNDEEAEDIDALLSLEDGQGEEGEEDDDDVISTGRTQGYKDGSSPDSACSSRVRKADGVGGGGGGSSSRKRERMKRMVKTLKGIVPGGERMDTPAVLDEAVKYLKSLKVEVKKLGMRNLD